MDLELSQPDFEYIRRLAMSRAGIQLHEGKRQMVRGRLVRRLRKLGLASFHEYRLFLEQNAEEELVELCNAITTNVTAFFRERHHFDLLRDEVLPALDAQLPEGAPIRLWSAGCSSGEEPYSIAMTCLESLGERGRPVRILATDLDTNVLSRAQSGIYKDEPALASVPEIARWFQRGRGANAGKVRARPELQQLITFRRLNLIEPFELRSLFHVIFCRNVVIYFSKETQRALFDRYAEQMADGGTLFIGHSESLLNVTSRFRICGPTMYRRVA